MADARAPAANPVRCAVYTRQSVQRATANDFSSCEAQRQHCALYIATQKPLKWTLLPTRYDDVGYSGATLDRPALVRLLHHCDSGQVDQVVTWKLDRLTRSLKDSLTLTDHLHRQGVGLVLAGQALGGSGPAITHFMHHMLASFAEFEREQISERLRDARTSRQQRGMRTSGPAPFGYTVERVTRQLIPHDTEAPMVRYIFSWAAEGASATEIADRLNDAGQRTQATAKRPGRRWIGRTILSILRNPAYVGQRRLKDGVINAVHPAIIDADLAARAEAAIAKRRTTTPRPRRNYRCSSDDPFLLRGLLHCAQCKRPMTTSSSKAVSTVRPNIHPRYYRCRGWQRGATGLLPSRTGRCRRDRKQGLRDGLGQRAASASLFPPARATRHPGPDATEARSHPPARGFSPTPAARVLAPNDPEHTVGL